VSSAIDRRQTVDMVRFILDRINDDDVELKLLARAQARNNASIGPERGVRAVSRQLADVEAKRQLLGSAQRLLVLRDLPNEKAVRDQAILMLRALAAPYSDHHNYQAEWHPSDLAQ